MTQRIYLQGEAFIAEYNVGEGQYLQVIEQISLDELFGSLTPQEAFKLRFAATWQILAMRRANGRHIPEDHRDECEIKQFVSDTRDYRIMRAS